MSNQPYDYFAAPPAPGQLVQGAAHSQVRAPAHPGNVERWSAPAPVTPDQAAAIAVLGRKSAGVAAVLSLLLTGAGQLYAGRVGRGVAFLAAAFVSGLLAFVLIGFVLLPIVWIWALVDAVWLANRHNDELGRRLALPHRL